MHDATPAPEARHVPFKQEGWGSAALVILLVLACIAWATYVHKTTYLHPTDVHMQVHGERNADGAQE
jgi:hypothetical protein